MRDDLHKGAAVPREWQRLIRTGSRDADWEVRGIRVAEIAIRYLLNLFSRSLLSGAAELLASEQLRFDSSRDVDLLRQRCQASPVESAFLDEVKITLNDPGYRFTPEVVPTIVAGIVEESCDQLLRASALHVNQKAPDCTHELLRRMRTLLGKVDIQEQITLKLNGLRSQQPSSKSPVDPDEALPIGGK